MDNRDITLFPWRGKLSHLQAFSGALVNPTEQEYKDMILATERSTWPQLPQIRTHCAVEVGAGFIYIIYIYICTLFMIHMWQQAHHPHTRNTNARTHTNNTNTFTHNTHTTRTHTQHGHTDNTSTHNTNTHTQHEHHSDTGLP